MQVDKQSFSVNVVYFDDKKSWFSQMWPIKTKSRALSLMTLGLSMKTQNFVLGKLLLNGPQMEEIH